LILLNSIRDSQKPLEILIFKIGVSFFHVRIQVLEHDFKHSSRLWKLDFSYSTFFIATGRLNVFWKWKGARICLEIFAMKLEQSKVGRFYYYITINGID